jgi:hypothetical protein
LADAVFHFVIVARGVRDPSPGASQRRWGRRARGRQRTEAAPAVLAVHFRPAPRVASAAGTPGVECGRVFRRGRRHGRECGGVWRRLPGGGYLRAPFDLSAAAAAAAGGSIRRPDRETLSHPQLGARTDAERARREQAAETGPGTDGDSGGGAGLCPSRGAGAGAGARPSPDGLVGGPAEIGAELAAAAGG